MTASAGVGGETAFRAGRLGNSFIIVVTGSCYFVTNIGMTASAGVGGETAFRAGRFGNSFIIIVTGSCYGVTRVGVTAFAGKGGVTVFRAGRFSNAFSIHVFVNFRSTMDFDSVEVLRVAVCVRKLEVGVVAFDFDGNGLLTVGLNRHRLFVAISGIT